MSTQRDVQRQAAATKASIKRAVAVGVSLPTWLRSLLQQRALAQQAGLLVRYSEVPEQEGNLHKGVWLTDSLQFWEFEVIVSRGSCRMLNVEKFTNSTSSLPAIASLPGIGPSFSYLALQVLHEMRDA